MRVRKTEKADLENKKSLFFLVGLVIVLSGIWWAFEYKVTEKPEIEINQQAQLEEEEDIVIQTKRNEPPPPPPEQPKSQVIEIVDDDIEVDIDLEIDVEADEETIIDDAPIIDETEDLEAEEKIFVFLEDQPEYPGGDEARIKFIANNIEYPEIAKESGVQGTVYLTFVVEKDGSISNVRVLRGIGAGCDEEAIRVVKNMPNWKPGKQRGRSVRAQFNMPIKFILQ